MYRGEMEFFLTWHGIFYNEKKKYPKNIYLGAGMFVWFEKNLLSNFIGTEPPFKKGQKDEWMKLWYDVSKWN